MTRMRRNPPPPQNTPTPPRPHPSNIRTLIGGDSKACSFRKSYFHVGLQFSFDPAWRRRCLVSPMSRYGGSRNGVDGLISAPEDTFGFRQMGWTTYEWGWRNVRRLCQITKLWLITRNTPGLPKQILTCSAQEVCYLKRIPASSFLKIRRVETPTIALPLYLRQIAPPRQYRRIRPRSRYPEKSKTGAIKKQETAQSCDGALAQARK